jgi:hypothetical protein
MRAEDNENNAPSEGRMVRVDATTDSDGEHSSYDVDDDTPGRVVNAVRPSEMIVVAESNMIGRTVRMIHHPMTTRRVRRKRMLMMKMLKQVVKLLLAGSMVMP